MTSLLKLSNSIATELIPGDDNYLDKKSFVWSLFVFDENMLGIEFKFDYPEYISVDQLDSMKITYFQTDTWISPQNSIKLNVPDGYTQIIEIRP